MFGAGQRKTPSPLSIAAAGVFDFPRRMTKSCPAIDRRLSPRSARLRFPETTRLRHFDKGRCCRRTLAFHAARKYPFIQILVLTTFVDRPVEFCHCLAI